MRSLRQFRTRQRDTPKRRPGGRAGGIAAGGRASVVLVALCACDPGMITEEHQVRFEDAFGGAKDFINGWRVVEGTRWCPAWDGIDPDQSGEWEHDDAQVEAARECFDFEVSGGGSLDDEGCVLVGSDAAAVYEMLAVGCTDFDFVDDRFSLTGVSDAQLEAAWRTAVGAMYEADGSETFAGLPADFLRIPNDAPVQVMQDTEHAFATTLSDDAGPVHWSLADSDLNYTGAAAEFDGLYLSHFRLGAGETLDLTLDNPDISVDFPSVVGVDGASAVSLEFADGGNAAIPVGAGVVRDDGGRIIYGVDVQIELEEPYLVDERDSEDEALYRGVFSIDDGCFEPGDQPRQHHSAVTLRALGLEASATMSWEQAAGAGGESWNPPDDCPYTVRAAQGCACDARRGATPPWLLLLLLFGRRRVSKRPHRCGSV